MCQHLTNNPNHKVDFAKLNILSSSGDSARLLILESLFIKKYEPLRNVDSNSLLVTYLILNITPSVYLLAFGL